MDLFRFRLFSVFQNMWFRFFRLFYTKLFIKNSQIFIQMGIKIFSIFSPSISVFGRSVSAFFGFLTLVDDKEIVYMFLNSTHFLRV